MQHPTLHLHATASVLLRPATTTACRLRATALGLPPPGAAGARHRSDLETLVRMAGAEISIRSRPLVPGSRATRHPLLGLRQDSCHATVLSGPPGPLPLWPPRPPLRPLRATTSAAAASSAAMAPWPRRPSGRFAPRSPPCSTATAALLRPLRSPRPSRLFVHAGGALVSISPLTPASTSQPCDRGHGRPELGHANDDHGNDHAVVPTTTSARPRRP
jgi:hypothetical protein